MMGQTAKIKMIKKDPCPYCDRAIRFLQNKGLEFEILDLTGKWDELDEWKEKTGWMTVPIILINDKLVGGYQDMKRLDEDGKFDALVGI